MVEERFDTVHKRIRYVWEQSKLSQPAFARLVEIGQPHLNGVMSLTRPSNASRHLLERISEKTGASLSWLETGEGEPFPGGAHFEEEPAELTDVIKRLRQLYHSTPDEAERHETTQMLNNTLSLLLRRAGKAPVPEQQAPANAEPAAKPKSPAKPRPKKT